MVLSLEIRDKNGRFVKGHEVPDKWRKKFRTMYKGKRFSSKTEFKKGHVPWNIGKECPYVKGEKNPMKKPEIRNKVMNNLNVKKTQFKKGSIPWNKNKRNVYSKETKEKIQKGWFKKGHRVSPKTEFKKGSTPWNKGKEHFYIIGKKHPFYGKHLSKETRSKISKSIKNLYKNNPDYLKRILTFRRPNKAEKKLDNWIQSSFPNEFEFVGNGSFIIEGLNPDWINCNGKKQIIELFGERWHEPEEEQLRKDIFAKYGYQTLVIWYEELRNKRLVLNKIKNFLKGPLDDKS